MNATANIKLKSLAPYLHLFPKATGIDHIVKKGASVSDTVKFMPQAAKLSRWMVKDFVKAELKGLSVYEACEKLWHFVKEHIAYEKDDANYQNENSTRENFEQVRSPRRLIADGKGDCDCMTNFVNACMLEFGIKGITINRITAYDYNDFFQHIYSLIPDENGKYIIMDCVWNEFNTEKKYTNKQDYKMELQFLDGIGSANRYDDTISKYNNMDAQDVYRDKEDYVELGKLFKRKSASNNGGSSPVKHSLFKHRTAEQKQSAKERQKHLKEKGRKFANKTNKINPATALLRAGLLASMKLNVLKVPQSLKWGYASKEYAQEQGMDMSKYDRLKKVLDKTQSIFYLAGGKPENLRKAILTGRGNINQEVAGTNRYSDTMPLSNLLGSVYQDELVNDMQGFEGFDGLLGHQGLGEPTTAAAITAASATMGALAALIKSIGTLFPKKGSAKQTASEQEEENGGGGTSTETNETPTEEQTEVQPEENPETKEVEKEEETQTDDTDAKDENEETKPATTSTELMTNEEENEVKKPDEESTNGLAGIGSSIKTYYQNNKKWINPVAVTIGIGTVAYFVINALHKEKTNTAKNEDAFDKSIEGIKNYKQNQRRKFQVIPQRQQKSIIHLK